MQASTTVFRAHFAFISRFGRGFIALLSRFRPASVPLAFRIYPIRFPGTYHWQLQAH